MSGQGRKRECQRRNEFEHCKWKYSIDIWTIFLGFRRKAKYDCKIRFKFSFSFLNFLEGIVRVTTSFSDGIDNQFSGDHNGTKPGTEYYWFGNSVQALSNDRIAISGITLYCAPLRALARPCAVAHHHAHSCAFLHTLEH